MAKQTHEERKAYWRKYNSEHNEKRKKQRRDCYKKMTSTEEGVIHVREQAYASRRKYPEKESARSKVSYAVRTGKLKKLPCVDCGDLNSNAHHSDYSKPLDIVWVCRSCHGVRHRS